ncbi:MULTISPECIES: hypothetical protein [unclassified Streptomyces]|uniref:hypothetical protein n=1 Tax=unclassified Streptomyces TaxID=2593676 RepID=UPI00236603D2|nr:MULTISPECIES: hypothetical protein [unclassified Streptomyces]MDF3141954.1 hypothetical protein [Streptomyces sp. T21Q-yed]WDF40339.1 hypothetical protein PBV52_27935 [Streptomyces sp. T12]
MRRMRVAGVCGAAVVAAVGGVAPYAAAVDAGAVGAGAVGRPEAGLAYHGSAALSGGQVHVRFTPHNHGPSALPASAVRLRWSEPLADRQTLPEGCGRAGERTVMCRVGALEAVGAGKQVELRVGLRGAPSEVLLEFGTVRSGGAADGDGGRGRQRVLVLDTGDTYYF